MSPPSASSPSGKKPYEKPAIILEEKLEAVAAVCDLASIGKAPGVCAYAFS